jgi:hypothetical protein
MIWISKTDVTIAVKGSGCSVVVIVTGNDMDTSTAIGVTMTTPIQLTMMAPANVTISWRKMSKNNDNDDAHNGGDG